ncbi:MAG TPA: DUF3516 domain-containing protein, partial [Mycobacteriales bacterium]|nr:DUF3516 domain-containing protein [Mycobacteriales bacterium]
AQIRHIRHALAIYRALSAAGVIERRAEPDEQGRTFALTAPLQLGFALNQPLSPLALAALDLLDPESESYALDVVSIIESIVEDPRPVLSAQRSKARGEAVSAMKAEGIEYDERMELLEDITYPRPLADLLEAAYEMYRGGHPWVADHEIRPKSVAREMYEQAMTFTEYVSYYRLARAEGTVLRYLADVYKALKQTVPDTAKNDELVDITEWLGELVRQVDSSLLDEWERLRSPGAPVDENPPPVTTNSRAFRVLVRNQLFRRVELAARRRYFELGELDGDDGWDAQRWQDAIEDYFAEHDELGSGADARGPALLIIDEQAEMWNVRQIFDDPEGDHDWGISAEIDLPASNEAGTAVLHVTAVNRL